MFQPIAALPLALTAALLLFSACDDGDSEGGETDGTQASSSTGGPGGTSTAPGTTTTTASGSTTEVSTSTAGETNSSGLDESSTGDEDSSGSQSGSSSTGDPQVGIADAAGTYIETWGAGKADFFTHDVTASTWTTDFGEGKGVLTYEMVDDEARWVAGDDGLGTYTRYDWDFDDDGNLRYCTAVFGAETLEEAVEAPPSNADDFDGVGCAGAFPWSLLVLQK